MSDTPQGPGWWMADDQRWYPPDLRSGASTSPPEAGQPPPTPKDILPSKNLWKGLIASVVVLALALVATIVVLVTRGTDTETTSAATTPVGRTTTTSPLSTSTVPVTTTSNAPPPTTAPTPAAPTSAPGVESGDGPVLLCKDLKAKGYNYSEAVIYWTTHGLPEALDADKNGIPCETVYSEREVTLYWGATGPEADGSCPSAPTLLAALRATPQLDEATGYPGVLGQIQCALPFATAFDTSPGDGETAQLLFKAISGYWVALDGGTSLDCQGQWSIPAADAEILGC